MRLVFVVVGLLALSLLLRLVHFYAQNRAPSETINRTITLFDEPKRYSFYQSIWVDEVEFQLPKYPQYHYGDTLSLQGEIESDTYLTDEGESIEKRVVKDPVVNVQPSPFIIRFSSKIRNHIIQSLSEMTDSDAAALLLGITLGAREGFSSELYDRFRLVGILHVVAASGSNVALLAGVLLHLFSWCLRRKTAIICTGVLLIWYALLSGFDPAILRATAMAWVVFSAQLLGRQNSALFSLVIVACGMLLISPALLEDVGFQLSVTATLGIVLTKSLLEAVWIFKRVGFIKDDLTTTIAATWGSLPVIIWQFGTFAPLGILVNILILWTVPMIMILGMAASVSVFIFPWIANLFVYLAYPLIYYFLLIAELFERLVVPLNLPTLPFAFTISYGFISLSIILMLRRIHAT